ncbi:MAG: Crp/Fnr family transcriptional regulator [Rhodocyclaceae bacterium]|jgi:CRP-like cAMP-binding protein|nr:Crp/Fnr family transcriptional regulator [Rhodocyclaceae bacterium]MCL4758222.1 Crp/Fnr family transcriptional regulator [Rhodocyclaceae bacterium]
MTTGTQSFIEQALSGIEPFDGLRAEAIEMLARGARMRRLGSSEIIVHRGDRPSGMFLVVEGEVKLFLISSAGAERIVRLAAQGDTFCEEGAFGNKPQSLAAQATRDSVVVFIPQRALQEAMDANPAIARALLARLSDRIFDLVTDIEQCEQRSGAQRVAHYLVKHASRASDAIEVRLSSKKQTIASQLNMTPESFSRVLNRLTREGFILPRGRRAIMLTDLNGLQSLAA